MTINVYRGTDASAPTLDAVQGGLVALLDACLINGYGAQPAATGWTKPYADASGRAVYQYTGEAGHSYLRLIDDGTTDELLEIYEAKFQCYENMTDVDTGTGLWTPDDYYNGDLLFSSLKGPLFQKFAYGSVATVSTWMIVVNKGNLILCWNQADPIVDNKHNSVVYFGKYKSYDSTFAYNEILMCPYIQTQNLENGPGLGFNSSSERNAALRRTQVPPQETLAIQAMFAGWDYMHLGDDWGTNTTIAYPNGGTGGLIVSDVEILEDESPIGIMPGVWVPCHNKPFAHFDTFDGVIGGVSRDFVALVPGKGSSPYYSQVFIEVSDTWDF